MHVNDAFTMKVAWELCTRHEDRGVIRCFLSFWALPLPFRKKKHVQQVALTSLKREQCSLEDKKKNPPITINC